MNKYYASYLILIILHSYTYVIPDFTQLIFSKKTEVHRFCVFLLIFYGHYLFLKVYIEFELLVLSD